MGRETGERGALESVVCGAHAHDRARDRVLNAASVHNSTPRECFRKEFCEATFGRASVLEPGGNTRAAGLV